MAHLDSLAASARRLAAPLGRVLIAALFVIAGLNKIAGYEATQGYMAAMGVPGALLPLVILLELGAGLAVAVGWRTRTAAVLLAGFSLLSALIFHFDLADELQVVMLLKNVAIAGGLLVLAANGPGALALDGRLRGKQEGRVR